MYVVIIAGSRKDRNHVEDIEQKLTEHGANVSVFYHSAHKEPRKVLGLLEEYSTGKVVFVTVAGRSNALSGMVAANTHHVTIACPPFATTADYLADIHSTLRMPSDTPVLTVLGAENCALAVLRILRSWGFTHANEIHHLQAVS